MLSFTIAALETVAKAVPSTADKATGTASTAMPESIQKIPAVHWVTQHWIPILVIFAILLIFIIIMIPIIKIIKRKIKNRQTAKELKEDLLLRKQLSTMAQGGSRGEKAEQDILHVRLSEIKNNFQYGAKLFKQSGKSIYDLPLYLLVGEPGAGKSDMMRYSGLEFPAGLVDISQGESGTSTLHWWLSNDAAIIDVGGKVFFNRWGGQSDAEWGTLLRLIRKSRPKLPLNGIILAIPADALLADNDILVKKKASMISDELRTLQKSTGLCLPVYITVTKMDQVVGFREFFMHLKGGQLDQMFGWSNPSTNGTYSAEAMSKVFSDFSQNLKTYRSNLMLSSNLWEAGSNRQRAEHAAPLYAFPDSLSAIETNLASYLKTIFTPSQWGGRTRLMLQGIYMTSAIDKGSVHDEQYAECLGKTVDEAPVKRMPDTGRHLFIKELFQTKIFQESGLVFFDFLTKIKRRRPYFICSILAIICATYLGITMFTNQPAIKEIVKNNTPDWNLTYKLIKDNQLIKSPLIEETKIKGTFSLAIFDPVSSNSKLSREAYIKRQLYLSTIDLNLPLNFYLSAIPFNGFKNNLFVTKREDVYQMVFSQMYFLPFVKGAREKFMSTVQKEWTHEANEALKTLLDIEYAYAQRLSSGNCNHCIKRFSLKSLSDFIYPNKFFAFNPEVEGAGWLYDISNPNSKLFHLLEPGTANSRIAIQKGVDNFCKAWLAGQAYPSLTIYKVSDLLNNLKEYRETETSLLKLKNEIKNDTLDSITYNQAMKKRQHWLKLLNKLKEITKRLNSLSAILAKEKTQDIDQLLDKAINEYSKIIEKNFSNMIQITQKSKLESAKEFFNDINSKLIKTRKKIESVLEQRVAELNLEINTNTPQIWTKSKDKAERDYQLKTQIYSSTDALTLPQTPIKTILMLRDRINSDNATVTNVGKQLKQYSQQFAKDQYIMNSINLCQSILNLTKRLNTCSLLTSALKIIPSTSSQFRALVATRSPDYPPISAPILPLTQMNSNFNYNNQFNPMVVQNIIEEFNEIKRKLNITTNTKSSQFADGNLTIRFIKVDKAFNAYLMEYIDYWSRDVLVYSNISQIKSWPTFQKSALTIKSYQINGALISLYNQCLDALLNLKLKKNSRLDTIRNQNTKFFQSKLLLLNETFNATCIQTLATWATLPENSTAAYSTIIDTPPKDILANYLAVYSTDEKSRIPWWSEYIKTGVTCLKNLINKKFQADIRKISANMMYFPLCNTPDRRTILSPEEIADECDLLYKSFAFTSLKSSKKKSATAGSKTDKKTVPSKLLTDIGLIQELNESISFKTKAQLQWWKKISTVINVLNNRDKPLTWTLLIPGKTVANKVPQFATLKEFTPAQERFRYFEVYSKGVRLGKRMSTFQSSGKPLEQPAVTEFASAEDLNLVFFKNVDDEKPGAISSFNGQWGAMNLFLRPGVWFDQKLKAFIVPISFTDKSGYNCYYWIGLKFNRNVPPPTAWPTLDDWIDFSPFRDSKKTAFELNRYFAKLVSDGKLNTVDSKNYQSIVKTLKAFGPYNSNPVFKFYLPSLQQQKTKIMNFMGMTGKDKFTSSTFPIPDSGITLMRYLEIYVNGKLVGSRMKTVMDNGLENHNTGIVLPAIQGKIEFRFFEFDESQKPATTVTLPGPYAIFKLMTLPSRTKNTKDFSFMLPLFLERIKGANYFYWIGVSLDYQYAVPPDTTIQSQ